MSITITEKEQLRPWPAGPAAQASNNDFILFSEALGSARARLGPARPGGRGGALGIDLIWRIENNNYYRKNNYAPRQPGPRRMPAKKILLFLQNSAGLGPDSARPGPAAETGPRELI